MYWATTGFLAVNILSGGLAARIRARAGIVEHGLFVGLTSDLIVAGADGLRHLVRPGPG